MLYDIIQLNESYTFDRLVVETMQSVCLMESGDNMSDSLKEETNLMGLTFGGYLQSKVKLFFCLKKCSVGLFSK